MLVVMEENDHCCYYYYSLNFPSFVCFVGDRFVSTFLFPSLMLLDELTNSQIQLSINNYTINYTNSNSRHHTITKYKLLKTKRDHNILKGIRYYTIFEKLILSQCCNSLL